MIPQAIRLHINEEFTSGAPGVTLPGWLASGGTSRPTGNNYNWPRYPHALPWEREAAS